MKLIFNLNGIVAAALIFSGIAAAHKSFAAVGPPPRLRASKVAANQIAVFWPASYSNFVFEAAPSVPSSSWTTISTLTISGDEIAVTNTMTKSQEFYRLRDTSSAPVHSINVMGYINVLIPPGLSILANPLNATENRVAILFADAPAGFTVYTFNGTSFQANPAEVPVGGPGTVREFSDPEQHLNPGEGCFVRNPLATRYTNIFLGEVPQGRLGTPLAQGLRLISSQVPHRGLLQSELGFPAVAGDQIYRFVNTGDPATTGYRIYAYEAPPGGGAPEWDEEPIINVAEGFFARIVAAAIWMRNFNVNT